MAIERSQKTAQTRPEKFRLRITLLILHGVSLMWYLEFFCWRIEVKVPLSKNQTQSNCDQIPYTSDVEEFVPKSRLSQFQVCILGHLRDCLCQLGKLLRRSLCLTKKTKVSWFLWFLGFWFLGVWFLGVWILGLLFVCGWFVSELASSCQTPGMTSHLPNLLGNPGPENRRTYPLQNGGAR